MTQISIQNVSKHYSGHTALDNVSFEIPDGSIFGLLGPNGAGKTSLIRIINQITGADEGSILFDGHKIGPEDVKRIGYLPEERGLYGKMKVLDQIMYFARLKGRSISEAREVAIKWLTRFDLMDWRNKKSEELSKGMQQKVQFIITVLHEPEVIILDEPFTGFDPINTEIIKQEIRSLRDKGATIIFSTHRMESVEEICDHVGMINRSRKVLEGPVSEIKSRYKMGKFQVEFAGDQDPSGIPGFENSEKINGGMTMATFDLNGMDKKDWISKVNQSLDISSIREIIPSMHQIFIQTVNDSDHA